jgi:hypothetical protein
MRVANHHVVLLAAFAAAAGCTGTEPGTSSPSTDTSLPTTSEPTGDCPSGTVCTIAGVGMSMFNGLEGDPRQIGLFNPSAAVTDPAGRLVIVDYNNNVLRRIDEDGVLRTIVGNGSHGYAIDGAPATETPLENVTDIVYRDDGAAFLYEQHGARILTVGADDWLTIYAGDPFYPGYNRCDGDGRPAREAGMTEGWGVTLGDDGTVYFAEPYVDRIREVTPDQHMAPVAGLCDPTLYHLTAGFTDGVGEEARFRVPYGVHFHDGWLYVSDTGNHAIRRIDPSTNEVVTIAGTGAEGWSGDGGPASAARLSGPIGLDFDASGAMFVADSGNNVIRRIDPDGTIATVAGTGVLGFAGDGGPPLEAQLAWPNDVHVRPNGDVVIVDTLNSRVRLAVGLAAADG